MTAVNRHLELDVIIVKMGTERWSEFVQKKSGQGLSIMLNSMYFPRGIVLGIRQT
jgi:hypothetical protein